MKTAFITGITGQDGSYLAEFLLNKGYIVHGLKRRASTFNTKRIDHLYHAENGAEDESRLQLHYGDLSDSLNLTRLIETIQPDEVYNLAAQSHVKISFDVPEYTADIDALGVLRILDAIRFLKPRKQIKFYQASTSELFGQVKDQKPQNEETPFHPCSPYAAAKLFAYWTTVNYRMSYNLFACNGILFNHESPRRGENFVTRKIVQGAVRIRLGSSEPVVLGNLDAKRDWGHAADYVKGMWLMLQAEKPDDYVLATGRTTSIREFCKIVFAELGIPIEWRGTGLNETGYNVLNNQTVIRVSETYYRPADVEYLLGDARKAQRLLGWQPEHDLHSLIHEMVEYDYMIETQKQILRKSGQGVENLRGY